MIPQILQRTPPWVFVVFAVLLILGTLQARTRELGRLRIALMPAIFLPLSLWSIWNAFGSSAMAYGGWLAGVGAALLLNYYTRLPRQVSYSNDTRLFRVEGSWIPLAMMMAIFFARYAIAVATAMQPALNGMPAFAAAVGFAYGLFSGTFLARALRILDAAAMPRPAEARP